MKTRKRRNFCGKNECSNPLIKTLHLRRNMPQFDAENLTWADQILGPHRENVIKLAAIYPAQREIDQTRVNVILKSVPTRRLKQWALKQPPFVIFSHKNIKTLADGHHRWAALKTRSRNLDHPVIEYDINPNVGLKRLCTKGFTRRFAQKI